jgi:hypothetical protein
MKTTDEKGREKVVKVVNDGYCRLISGDNSSGNEDVGL